MADTIDEISGGRLIIGLGAGYAGLEFPAFGYPRDHLYSRFEEGLQIINGLLRDGDIDFKGEYHHAYRSSIAVLYRNKRHTGYPIIVFLFRYHLGVHR